MPTITSISKRIISLEQLTQKFPLVQANNDQFFPEWTENLPELTALEKQILDKYYQRYRRHRDRAELSEETVKLLLVFPLLELAGFYDEPFFVTAEAPVQIEIQDTHEILKGRIDTLIIQQEIWILIVESKRSVALTVAIPQCLAYMLGNPQPAQPLYGLVTDGDLFMFVKLMHENTEIIYDFSEPFSLLVARRHKLYQILQILKNISGVIGEKRISPD